MKVAYLIRIKDEEKLIYYNLTYYYNIGLRGFFVCLNNSNKETIELVNKFVSEHSDIEYFEYIDDHEDFNQVEMFNKMSNDAFSKGYKWQVPADADEILHILGNKTLKEIISEYDNQEYGYINLRWIDFHPSDKDNKEDQNYFTKWKHRNKNPRQPPKIIYKWSMGCKHGQGHHLLIAKRNLLCEMNPDVMFQAHFVDREHNQIKKKRIRIGEAFILKYGEDSEKPQIKEYRRWEKEGDSYFDKVWEDLCEKRKKNFENYIYDPINPELFQ